MRTSVYSAAIAVMLTMVTALPSARAQVSNNTPLAFGMNADEVSQVLGVTLVYVQGRPGDEMFLALPNVKGSALSDRRDGLYLQFRRGRLEGWKGDWGTRRPCCN
jgi:hypothetical protein